MSLEAAMTNARCRQVLVMLLRVGGGLAVYDDAEEEDCVYLYDANGNVGQVIDLDAASASAAIVAHYEYDPYEPRLWR